MLKGRRLDWLVFRLLNQVTSDYLHALNSKAAGFTFSNKLAKQARESALKSLNISDANVRLPTADRVGLASSAVVKSSNGTSEYTITSPGTPDASCDCAWAKRGNYCKHLMKVGFRSRNKAIEICSTISKY
jgi:hypothetical protein